MEVSDEWVMWSQDNRMIESSVVLVGAVKGMNVARKKSSGLNGKVKKKPGAGTGRRQREGEQGKGEEAHKGKGGRKGHKRGYINDDWTQKQNARAIL